MSAEYREKLASVGFHRGGRSTQTRTTVIARDDDGTPAGTQTEHWDGRQDATVFARKEQTDAQEG